MLSFRFRLSASPSSVFRLPVFPFRLAPYGHLVVPLCINSQARLIAGLVNPTAAVGRRFGATGREPLFSVREPAVGGLRDSRLGQKETGQDMAEAAAPAEKLTIGVPKESVRAKIELP